MTLLVSNKNHRLQSMNRSRRRMSLSVATLYSLCFASIVTYHRFVAGSVDQNYNIHSRLLRGLPTAIDHQPQIFAKRRSSAIDMSSFNDDTTLEEVEELMEEGNEQSDDDDSQPTPGGVLTDDDSTDGFLNEILDELTEAFVNVTNTTSDELFENMLDSFFGPSDSEENSNSTSSVDNVIEDVMNSIFGQDDDDDVPPKNVTVQEESENFIETTATIETQEVVTTTTNFEDKDTPPVPQNMTGGNTNASKEMYTDDNLEPEPPMLLTTSPSITPKHAPTSLPTESPTLERNDDFDSNDKETEKEDDDLFAEKTFHNKNRPVGSGIPNNKFNFTVVLGTFAAIVGMIFTAWQMSDNPDGIYASLCRLTLTCIHLVFRIIMSPCRKCCGGYRNHHLAGTNGYHEPYGHLPVSTMDYGYKDPALELT